LAFTLRALFGAAELASGQIKSTQSALRERAAELGAFAFPERDRIVNRCEKAADAFGQASVALGQVLKLPHKDGAANEARLDMLLEKLLDSMPMEDAGHEA
jgi:hypothetical protein